MPRFTWQEYVCAACIAIPAAAVGYLLIVLAAVVFGPVR